MSVHLKSKTVKTRKRRLCEWCAESIEIGQQAVYSVWVNDGLSCSYLHPECDRHANHTIKESGQYANEFTYYPGEYTRGGLVSLSESEDDLQIAVVINETLKQKILATLTELYACRELSINAFTSSCDFVGEVMDILSKEEDPIYLAQPNISTSFEGAVGLRWNASSEPSKTFVFLRIYKDSISLPYLFIVRKGRSRTCITADARKLSKYLKWLATFSE